MPTILELFKGSPQDKQVKADKETFIEQETSGIRVKSLVELNNPLIYGNEAIRIVQRSTPLVEKMKKGTGGTEGDGGLIGKGLSKITGGSMTSIGDVRDKINTTLGIPQGLIPSEVVGKIVDSKPNAKGEGSLNNSQTPITKDLYGPNGSIVGELLKKSGGGNPTTLGKQALGQGISYGKDKLRGELFGEGQQASTANGATGNKQFAVVYTTDERTYSDVNTSKTLITTKEELEDSKLDLSLVSPLYGVKRRGDDFGRFGKTKYGFKNSKNPGSSQNLYTPQINSKTGKLDTTYSFERTDTLDVKRGMFGKRGDKIILNPNSYESIDKLTGKVKIGGDEYVDLVPLWIGYYGNSKPTLFRGTIIGLTETVSPSWSSNNFVGNPYKFYTYESIERNVSFNISLYCNNALELAANWQRVSALTKMAYPSINDNLSNPPFISFKLGDIYTDKTGLIESLTYTMPDNGPWETEIDGFVLPKFIDVAITIKFVENVGDGSLNSLYNYKKSKEAVNKANEEAVKFSDSSVMNSDGSVNNYTQKLPKITPKGTVKGPSLSAPKLPKNLLTGKTDTTPLPTADVSKDTTLAQASTSDAFDGKTSTEKIKELESKQNLTVGQSIRVALLTLEGYKNYTGPKLGEHKAISNDDGLVMYSKDAGFGQDQVVRISSNGNVVGPYYTSGLNR